MLGLAVTGLVAAFMAGVAANVTAFNTVVTYDLIQAYFAKDRDPEFYLRAGRMVTIGGILISVVTALIAKGYSNIMNYIQTLFSIFNAPLFATFIIAMFWKRATRGVASAASLPAPPPPTPPTASPPTHDLPLRLGPERQLLAGDHRVPGRRPRAVVVSLVTKPKPDEELRGLVWGLTRKEEVRPNTDPRDKLWWRSPALLGGVAIAANHPEHHLHLGASDVLSAADHPASRSRGPDRRTDEEEIHPRRPPTGSTSAG